MKRLVLTKTHDHAGTKVPKLCVVMIHGIASNSQTFNGALGYLEDEKKLQDCRFVTFDLLGSGKSLKDDGLNYDYHDQLTALHNAIEDLHLDIPLVLVGHSLGTFIVTRYAYKYPGEVNALILLSPPVYTDKDFDSPAFMVGVEAFKKAVSIRNSKVLDEKAFQNSMSKIVLDRKNYSYLARLKLPTTLIYGNEDQLIAAYNIPALRKSNPNITTIKTLGRHGVSRDKYSKMPVILEAIMEKGQSNKKEEHETI